MKNSKLPRLGEKSPHDAATHSEVCVCVRVGGRVQGVGFRESVRRTALELGVSGWVRNIDDGFVEAFFRAPRPVLDQMLEYVARGPRAATIKSVEVSEVDADPLAQLIQGFEVLR